jgi:hypothetical protein
VCGDLITLCCLADKRQVHEVYEDPLHAPGHRQRGRCWCRCRCRCW